MINPCRTIFFTILIFLLPAVVNGQDFTGVDISAIYNDMAAQQNAQMQRQTQQIIMQVMQNPKFQTMYQQYRASGGTAPPEQYAYSYAATGGFSPQGMRNYQDGEAANAAKVQGAWQGYQNAQQNYRDAYNGYTGSYSNYQKEAGHALMGNSTYVQPGSVGNSVLPHTWQANTYNAYNGQTYYVDPSGQYYLVDPNNAGNMYPVYPNQ